MGSYGRRMVALWRSRRGGHWVYAVDGGRAMAKSTRRTLGLRGGRRSCYGDVDAANTGSTRRMEVALWRCRRGGHGVDAADGGRARRVRDRRAIEAEPATDEPATDWRDA